MKEYSRVEVEALIDALSDPSASVRLAALRAIVRLPLTTETWLEVSHYVESLLGTKLEGDTFDQLTANGIPFHELIEAAVFVPTLAVRTILRQMLEDKNPRIRSLVAHALATARDPAAIPQLFVELSEARVTGRIDAAKSLSLMRPSLLRFQTVAQLRSAYQKNADPDVKFWLAIALAVVGETAEIGKALKGLRKDRRKMRELHGDPSLFIKQLKRRGPFPPNVRELLQKFTEGDEDLASKAALTLYEAQMPQEQSESPASPPFSLSLPADPAFASLAGTVIEQIKKTGEIKLDLTNEQLISELLRHPSGVETQVVTLLFKRALDQKIGWPGNAIVYGVYDLGSSFVPDVGGLFESYRLTRKPLEPDERFDQHSLRWQIAWTVARAPQLEILQVLGPLLKAEEETERKAAAQLIEDSTVSSHQSFPPIFGGGSGPEDVTPGTLQLIGEEKKVGGLRGSRGGQFHEKRIGYGDPPGKLEGEGTRTWRGSGESDAESIELARLEAERAAEASVEEAKEAARDSTTRSQSRGGVTAKPPEKVINTGFATREQPADELLNTIPLKTGEKYFFWLDRSVPDEKTSAEVIRVDLPKEVPIGAQLTIAVFGFQDGIQVEPGGDIGELVVGLGREFQVVKQPSVDSPRNTPKSKTRLFFPVQMPAKAGEARMRCNIYWKQTLVQSRLITVQLMKKPVEVTSGKAIRSVLDYKLSKELNARYLTQLPEQKLSMMLNSNGNGTNSFHLLGSDGNDIFKQDDLRFLEGELQSMITSARETLRLASWNKKTEWKDDHTTPYKYKDEEKQLKRLKDDLINMARWGYGFYTKVERRFASVKGQDRAAAVASFQKLMLGPGIVEIAMKESPAYVLPGAMIYDYLLDATTNLEAYSLCPTFENAFNQDVALDTTECFKGMCPSRGKNTVVCPSGFWGFRHYLGMPLSVEDGLDAPATIDVKNPLKMAVGVATNMTFVKKHTDEMKLLRAGMGWEYADNRDKVFAAMKSSPHIVYFYCHGGYLREDQEPYLQVGSGSKEDPGMIVQSNLFAFNIVWDNPRPLVFINGCHTTAVEPQQALEFISPLITHSNSAGVIGTEITIFEELATVFAQECLRRFYAGETIGEAIRNSRLTLLSSGNPLGLVYIPFVKSSLKLNYLN